MIFFEYYFILLILMTQFFFQNAKIQCSLSDLWTLSSTAFMMLSSHVKMVGVYDSIRTIWPMTLYFLCVFIVVVFIVVVVVVFIVVCVYCYCCVCLLLLCLLLLCLLLLCCIFAGWTREDPGPGWGCDACGRPMACWWQPGCL